MKWAAALAALVCCNAAYAEGTIAGRLPGDRLALRFISRVAEAMVVGDLAAAWRSIEAHPQRALLPYRGLPSIAPEGRRGDFPRASVPGGPVPRGAGPNDAVAYRAVQIAFADSDVVDYATARPADYQPRPVRVLDPLWNRSRAVYLSRDALYVPAGAAQTFRVKLPARPRLETQLGRLGAAADFSITVDGKEVLARRPATAASWRDESIDLAEFADREVAITFRVSAPGPLPAHGFFADPIIWSSGAGAAGRNVIVILVDTLRRDALPLMPNVSALAAGGARFDQAITSATWTRPSLLALYGGDLPSRVGQSAEEMVPDEAARRAFYERAPPLLPRLLAARGFRTSAIGNNFFLLGYPKIGLDLGFEEVDDIRHPVLDTPAITRGALRFLQRHRDRAFLLHLHYDAPHWPYTPPQEHLARLDRSRLDPALQKSLWRDPQFRRYLAEAVYADQSIGEVLRELDRLALSSRTLVVVVGDHGEVFDPRHDHFVERMGEPTLYHHGWSAYDEILRVPLVLSLPGLIPPTQIAAQVPLHDLPRTIADYLELGEIGLPERGRSLRPLVQGVETADRVAITEGQNVRALRDGQWLYLERPDGRLRVGGVARVVTQELYDLRRDPAQHEDVAAANAPVRERLRAALAQALPPPPPDPGIVYHLHVAADATPRRVEATFRARGGLWLRAVSGGEAAPIEPGAVRLRFRGAGSCELVVDSPETAIEVALTVDGVALDRRRLLVGEFALPLLDGPPGALAGELLPRLDARRPPLLGSHGEIFLYRDHATVARAGGTGSDGDDASGNDEVTGMMQRWGYAQPAPIGGSR